MTIGYYRYKYSNRLMSHDRNLKWLNDRRIVFIGRDPDN